MKPFRFIRDATCRIGLAISLFCVTNCLAQPLSELGRRFEPSPDLDLAWHAATNDWPATLWVYRVVPTQFLPKTVSNLMALGSFTERDRDQTRSLNPIFDRPSAMKFRSVDQTRELGVFPNLGWIEYSDSKAVVSRGIAGVPKDEAKALKLAVKYFKKLGIDRSELAAKPHSSALQPSYILGEISTYTTNKIRTTSINRRGVMLARAIDGVSFLGKGTRDGCSIEFGNHARISQIRLLWRNLKRERLYPTATPETLIKWIREGKAGWEPPPADRFTDWPAVKKLTITKITAYYFGNRHFEIQDWVYPYATLEAIADTGNTNMTVYLHCPILDETKPLKTQSQRK
jgi:hypothetical protein